MLKTIFINLIKFGVTAGLIYWLLSSGKLDLKLIASLADHPIALCTAILVSIFSILLGSYRWKKILQSRSNAHLPLFGIMRINWIGQFFSSVLPGTVSGDLVKMLYVQKFDSNLSKRFVFASILIDRVMGLSGLILLVGLTSLIFGNQITEKAPAMAPLLEMNYFLSAIVVLGFLCFMFFHGKVREVFVILENKFLPQVWSKIISLWDDLTSIKSKMIQAVFISLLIQFSSVVIFWSLIQPYVGGHMDFIQALAFIPIGLMTLALPIAPGGLGVGHAIFQKLFEFAGITNGASLFNLFFFISLVVNLAGAVPYLLTKVKDSK